MPNLSNSQLYKKFSEHIKEHFSALELPCAVAVSGGGDSMALTFLLAEYFGAENIIAYHLNHNLREEAKEEAEWLQQTLNENGIKSIVETWRHGEIKGNVQQAARQARHNFFSQQTKQICIAHSRDDVVETLLMRLGRGSGLKGLASMEEKSIIQGTQILRPLLEVSRDEIRDFLSEQKLPYINDPSNENEAFFRVRVRRLKKDMQKAGLSFEAIAASAKSLRRAENALEEVAQDKLPLYFDGKVLKTELTQENTEIALRILSSAILTINPQPMAPRTSKRIDTLNKIAAFEKKFSLGGVTFEKKGVSYTLNAT